MNEQFEDLVEVPHVFLVFASIGVYYCLKGRHPLDILATDGVYREYASWHVRPHRVPKNGQLDPAQSKENDEFSEFRGNIERYFGTLTSRIGLINAKFRHGELRFNSEFKIGTYYHFFFILANQPQHVQL